MTTSSPAAPVPGDKVADPLPSVAMVRRARRASRLGCGHHVRPGAIIVHRAGCWSCLRCALAAVRGPRMAAAQ